MDSQVTFDIINHTSSLSIGIPLFCCILRFKALNTELRVLFVYILISALTEVIGYIQIRSNNHTYLTYHLFTVLECSILTYIYYFRYAAAKTRMAIAAFYFCFLILAFVILIVNTGYDDQSNILSTYEAAFLIALSGGYFLKIVRDFNIPDLNKFYFSWINTGVLIYFSMAFLLFLFEGYIEKRGLKTYNNLFTLHWLTNIGYNSLLGLGIWKIRGK